MPLIIEGPDSVGKTSAAKRILRLIADEQMSTKGLAPYYAHMSAPGPSWDYCVDYILRSQLLAVQDRFHLGGIVYGDIARGGSKIGIDKLRFIEAHLHLQGSFTVVMYDSELTEDTWKARTLGRPEMYDFKIISAANNEFRSIAEGKHRLHPAVDSSWDIGYGRGFPTDAVLLSWARAWMMRIWTLQEWLNDPRLAFMAGRR